MKVKILNEGSYGGAFDIEDDQLFTRDELNDVVYEIEDILSKAFHTDVVATDSWISDKEISVTISINDAEYVACRTIDLRKIRKPSDLQRHYVSLLTSDLMGMIKADNSIDESLHITDDAFLRDLDAYLRSELIYVEDLYIDGGDTLKLTINWGDWKHEHIRCDILLKVWIAQNTKYQVVNSATYTTEEDGSDTYSAEHTYKLAPQILAEDSEKFVIIGILPDYTKVYYHKDEGWKDLITIATAFDSNQEARECWFNIPDKKRFRRVFVANRPDPMLTEDMDLDDEFKMLLACNDLGCKVTRYAKEEYGEHLLDYCREVRNLIDAQFDMKDIHYWKFDEDDFIVIYFRNGNPDEPKIYDIRAGKLVEVSQEEIDALYD